MCLIMIMDDNRRGDNLLNREISGSFLDAVRKVDLPLIARIHKAHPDFFATHPVEVEAPHEQQRQFMTGVLQSARVPETALRFR